MFGVLSGIYGQRVPEPRAPWDPRAVSDPQIVVDEFPDDLRDASLGGGGDNRCAAQRRAAFADYLDVPLEEILEAAVAAELAPAPALPGMPRGQRRQSGCLPRNDQDQRAIEEVQLTLTSMFTSTSALLQGLAFLHRVLG